MQAWRVVTLVAGSYVSRPCLDPQRANRQPGATVLWRFPDALLPAAWVAPEPAHLAEGGPRGGEALDRAAGDLRAEPPERDQLAQMAPELAVVPGSGPPLSRLLAAPRV